MFLVSRTIFQVLGLFLETQVHDFIKRDLPAFDQLTDTQLTNLKNVKVNYVNFPKFSFQKILSPYLLTNLRTFLQLSQVFQTPKLFMHMSNIFKFLQLKL